MNEISVRDRSFATSILLENLIRSAYSERAPGQLQPLQWSILRYLASCDEEFATIGFTARYLGLSHSPVSRSVATLEKKGVLASFKRPNDGRGSTLKLTEKGHNLTKIDPLKVLASTIDALPEDLGEGFRAAVEFIVMEHNAKAAEI